jgi:hypothetical protein
MEIQLPEVQSYLEKIKSGSITDIRLPTIEIETGEVLTAFFPSGDNSVVKLKVLSSETVPLEAITSEEAEKEGFTVPDFCASQFLCGNIETRLDLKTMRSSMRTASLWHGPRRSGKYFYGKKSKGSVHPA